ncbi:DUF4397 domain-containing protein [Salinilacihabitans rarus]|uniref:DUF4397 domain-containing protein n=1 Tax=Salinilacihabitans rarus TaxID=2961596 RepID=UPI0020C8640F|nr:DUF4397 domain-containing protein [Salinilacihabitans rarus]
MTVSRRRTIQAIGGAAGLLAASSPVYARGEHEDDERKPKDAGDRADGGDGPTPPTTAVRVAHFSPDAPNVDVYVEGERVISDLAYGDVTPYLEAEPGTYTVTITAAGDPETVAFEGDVWLGRAFYTIAAIGELGAGTFRPKVLRDAGSALVRVVHASPDAPAVDVAANGALVAENLSFGESTNYVAVPAATYDVEVRPAGSTDAVATFELTLEQGVAYTAWAIGYLGGDEGREFTLRPTVDGPMAADG